MVDALLSAAAESDSSLDDMLMSINEEFVSTNDPPARFCEFCNSSNTPTWRRGPAGKGSLCNACGIKWRLRKRLKKNEKGSSSPPAIPDKKLSSTPPNKPLKKRKDPSLFIKAPAKIKEKTIIEFNARDMKRKKYYCKYCDQTFSLSQFRNSQQFGAHCSNCSRRPRIGEDGIFDDQREFPFDNYGPSLATDPNLSSPSPPASPPSDNRDGLLLRLLHVVEHQLVDVHELAQIKDELSTLKTELVGREEARKVELGAIRAKFRDDLDDLRGGLNRSVAAHEQLAAHRLVEMGQTIRIRGGLLY